MLNLAQRYSSIQGQTSKLYQSVYTGLEQIPQLYESDVSCTEVISFNISVCLKIDAAVNTNTIKTPIKRTISTGDATKTQILQVTANPNSAVPDAKRIKVETSRAGIETSQGTSTTAALTSFENSNN